MKPLVLAWVCLVCASARAQDAGTEQTDDPGLATAPGKTTSGEYGGVSLGGQKLPPHPPALPVKGGPQRMTWPGFQVRGGVPTVFLEMTAMPAYDVQDAPGQVTITLKNTVIPIRNNRRSLKVAYFNTPVEEIITQEKGRTVKVVIRTRGKSAPAHREHVEPGAGGFQILVVELP